MKNFRQYLKKFNFSNIFEMHEEKKIEIKCNYFLTKLLIFISIYKIKKFFSFNFPLYIPLTFISFFTFAFFSTISKCMLLVYFQIVLN